MASSFLMILLLALALLAQGQEPCPASCASTCCDAKGNCLPADLTSTDCAIPVAQCNTPEQCGSTTGCGCVCPGCPSCVQAKNPVFSKACSVNVVLVVDESASIAANNARDTVVNGVQSFANILGKVNEIGGTANLAVVEFADYANIMLNLPPIMYRDTAEFQLKINSYLNADCCTSKNCANNYDPQWGCTNWVDALKLVYTSDWCAQSLDTLSCTPAKPDIVVWFTDGNPTVQFNNDECDANCNSLRTRQSSAGPIGAGFGGVVGGACYYADLLKQQGTKIFLIGVGDVNAHIPNVELVTGPNRWITTQPDTFVSSDYVLGLNYADLATFFFQIAKGLCGCLQDQAPCVNPLPENGLPCDNATQFDARVRIRTGANSHQWPANSAIFSWIQYQFLVKPAVYAFQIQAPGGNISTSGNIVRTDLYQPCQVIRKTQCANGCFTVNDKSFIPRFFVSAGDTPLSAIPADVVASGLYSTCGRIFLKELLNTQQETIQYLWVNSNQEVCAARAVEGTLYEFFQDNAGTVPGVNYRVPLDTSAVPVVPFDFNQFVDCKAKTTCNSSVEVVYFIDNQFTPSDYALVISYVQGLIATYTNANQGIKIGIQLNNNVILPITPDLTGLSAQLAALPQQTGTFDFYTVVAGGINTFWPDAFRPGIDAPRYILTIVGGPDNHTDWTAEEVTAFRNTKTSAGVESWALGVAAGSIELTLLRELADLTPYTHFEVLGSATLLATNVGDQSTLMCPTTNLCDDKCLGLCVCGECVCANCAGPELGNQCYNTCCDVNSKLCSIANKVDLLAPYGCIPPSLTDPGTKVTCDAATGTCGLDTTCAGRSGCPASAVPSCSINQVDTSNCGAGCNLKARQCDCNDKCGSQCLNGVCAGAIYCNDSNRCTNDECRVVNVNGTSEARCFYTPKGESLCPSSPCVVGFCTDGANLTDILSNAGVNGTGVNNTGLCTYLTLPTLVDVCGVCGGNGVCAFPVPSNANVGAIVGGVIGGVAAAAIAALLAAWAKNQANAAPGATNALQSAALQTNPAYTTPGLAGDMPTI